MKLLNLCISCDYILSFEEDDLTEVSIILKSTQPEVNNSVNHCNSSLHHGIVNPSHLVYLLTTENYFALHFEGVKQNDKNFKKMKI